MILFMSDCAFALENLLNDTVPTKNDPHTSIMLVPPDNFGLVEDGIYRCASVDPLNFAFLETLDLTSIVFMDPEKPPRAFRQFLEEHSIQLLNKHDQTHSKEELKMEDWMLYKPSVISSIFQLLLNSSNHNILVVDKTETVVGLLRKIQKWSFSSIISEFRLYYGNKSSYFMESFLELLPIELVSFENMPTAVDSDKTSAEISSASNETLYDCGRRKSLDQMLSDDSGNLSQDFETNLSLSASPKIPENLLKLARSRKQKRKEHKTETSHQLNPRLEYTYYKPTNITINPLEKKRSISVKLPPEKYLPLWFINGRDAWEKEYQENLLNN